MNLSFQKSKNMLSSIKTQGKKGGKFLATALDKISKKVFVKFKKNPLSKNLKICFLASKLRD